MRHGLIDFKKYFIVGTNQTALHDTMNGTVTGELIRCKDCKLSKEYYHGEHSELGMITYLCRRTLVWDLKADDYCSRAERKEE